MMADLLAAIRREPMVAMMTGYVIAVTTAVLIRDERRARARLAEFTTSLHERADEIAALRPVMIASELDAAYDREGWGDA
jgi:hypothetical protein